MQLKTALSSAFSSPFSLDTWQWRGWDNVFIRIQNRRKGLTCTSSLFCWFRAILRAPEKQAMQSLRCRIHTTPPWQQDVAGVWVTGKPFVTFFEKLFNLLLRLAEGRHAWLTTVAAWIKLESVLSGKRVYTLLLHKQNVVAWMGTFKFASRISKQRASASFGLVVLPEAAYTAWSHPI